MGFHEVQFPVDISYRSAGGPGFSTSIVEVDSGAEERIARWAGARRHYDVAYGIRSRDDISDLIKFYLARQGAAYGFRFKDWHDYSSASNGRDSATNADQNIGTGDGSTTTFQLVKKYTSGGTTTTRNITKLVSGTVLVAVDGVAKTEGVDFTVDTTTGIVTFASAPANTKPITAGFEFDVPVRFGREVDDALMARIDAHGIAGVSSIPLVEVRDEGAIPEDFLYGGGAEIALTADTQISLQTGKTLSVTPDANGRKLKLPEEDDLALGGPYFFLINESGSYNFLLRNYDDDTTIVTVAASEKYSIVLASVSSVKTWKALSG